MQNNGSTSSRSKLIVVLAFLLFGIVCIYLIDDTFSFAINSDKVNAVIESVETEMDDDGPREVISVSYEYKGIEYGVLIENDLPAFVSEGKEITIFVDKDAPEDARTARISGSALLWVIAMVSMMSFVIYLSRFPRKYKAKNKEPIEKGILITATIDEIIVDHSISINDIKRQSIRCSYYDRFTGERYEFISDKVWDNLNMKFRPGYPIQVYVMPDDYNNYHVDIQHFIALNNNNANVNISEYSRRENVN